MATIYLRNFKGPLLLALLIIPVLQLGFINTDVKQVYSHEKTAISKGEIINYGIKIPVFPSRDQKLTVNTTRTLTISEFSLVSLNDTIVIKNLDENSFNAILVFYEKTILDKLVNLRVMSLWLDKDTFFDSHIINYYEIGDYIALNVLINRVISKGDTYRISILADLAGMISFQEYEGALRFYLNLTRDILLPLHINESRTEVIPPLYSEILDTLMTPREGFGIQGNKVFWKTENLAPFNASISSSDLVKISYVYRLKDPIQLPLEVLYAKRFIKINADGKITITDKIRVTTLTPEEPISIEDSKWKAQAIVLGLAGNIDPDTVTAKDRFGSLKITEETTLEKGEFENYTFIRVSFRNPLIGGESYELSITYPLEDESSISKHDDAFEVSIPLMPILNASVNLFELEIESIYEVTIENANALPVPVYTKKVYNKGPFFLVSYQSTKMIYSDVYSSANKVITFKFEIESAVLFNALIVLFEYLFITVGGLALITREIGRKKLAIKIEEAPAYGVLRENLIKFIANYEEYLSKEDEIVTELRERAVERRPVAKIAQSLAAKLEELRRKKSVVYELSEKIKEDPDIVPLIEKLSELDTRTDLVRRKLLDDLNRHLRGAMKRNEFVFEANLALKELLRYIRVKRRALNSIRDILITKYSRE